jgi:hypothetical protein
VRHENGVDVGLPEVPYGGVHVILGPDHAVGNDTVEGDAVDLIAFQFLLEKAFISEGILMTEDKLSDGA